MNVTTQTSTSPVLVDAAWAQEHLDDPAVRFVEVDVDTTAYEQSHIPGAVGWDWTSQLSDGIRRDIAGREDFSALLSAGGHRRRRRRSSSTATTTTGSPPGPTGSSSCTATPTCASSTAAASTGSTTACRCRSTQPSHASTSYQAPEPDFALRAFRDDILPRLGERELALVDVRSPAEFNGEVIAPPGMTETAQRAGHIPGAVSIPWAQTVREDGTFKSADELARSTRARA